MPGHLLMASLVQAQPPPNMGNSPRGATSALRARTGTQTACMPALGSRALRRSRWTPPGLAAKVLMAQPLCPCLVCLQVTCMDTVSGPMHRWPSLPGICCTEPLPHMRTITGLGS